MRFELVLIAALLFSGCITSGGKAQGPNFEGRRAVDLLPEEIVGYKTGEVNTKSQGDCISGASAFYYQGTLEDYDAGALVMVCELAGGKDEVEEKFGSRSTDELCREIYKTGAFEFCQAIKLANDERAIVSWFETSENPVWIYWAQDRFYYYVIFEGENAFDEAINVANFVMLEQYGYLGL